ncbi:MAG: Ig-like domain-containing protein, partial [Erysipelotrichaceae bacterium]|nr:Ig-like domain-containing protein [Erysipelotrichaceae bacterium]
PSTMKEIKNNAFENCIGLPYILFNEGLETIGANAFRNCDGLTSLTLPTSLKTIGNGAFAENQNLKKAFFKKGISSIAANTFSGAHEEFTIYAPKNSNIIDFAITNNYRFIPVDAEEDGIIDRSASYFTTNYNDVSVSGYSSFIIQYRIKDEYAADTQVNSVSVNFGDQMVISEMSIKVNGTDIDEYTNENNILSIPVTEKEGVITLAAKPLSSRSLFAAAVLHGSYLESTVDETIGYIQMDVPTISIEAPERSGTRTFNVSGVAPASEKVDLYIDDELLTSVTASKAGRYTAVLTIPSAVNGSYHISAKVTVNGVTAEKSAMIYYEEGAPELISFKMYYFNHDETWKTAKVIDLTDEQSRRQTITFNPGWDYRFTVEMKNPEMIDRVYVIGRSGGERKVLEANWDQDAQMFVTSGFFDPNNKSYVPGTVSVQYFRKEEVDINQKYDINDPEKFGDVPGSIRNATYTEPETVTEGGKKTTTSTITLADDASTELTLTLIEEVIDKDLADVFREVFDPTKEIEEITGADGSVYYVQVDIDDYEVSETIYDRITKKAYKEIISKYPGGSTINTVWGFVEDGAVGLLDVAMTRFEIECSGMSQEDKAKAYAQLDHLVDYYCTQLTFKYVFFAVGMVCPELAAPLAIVEEAVEKAVRKYYDVVLAGGSMNFSGIMDLFLDCLVEVLLDKLKFLIDPSGTVYEGVITNTLEDVTVSVYFKDEETGETILWNAGEYDQLNPQITGSDGTFAWDVPEGLWMVKAEKEGYETYTSEWMEVPPPRTGLYARMIPTEAPYIVSINPYTDYLEIVFSQYVDPAGVSSLVLTDAEGNVIPYTLVYSESETDENGNVYAKTYRLVYSNALSEGTEVKLSIPENSIITADGKALEAFEETVTIKAKEEILSDEEEFTITYGTETEKIVTIANYSEGQKAAVYSSDPVLLEVRAAETDSTGIVTITMLGKATGNAAILVQVEGTEAKKMIPVHIIPKEHSAVAVTGISLDQTELVLNVGESRKLNASVTPGNADNKKVSWTSNDETIAAVLANGTVNALSKGSAVITVTTEDGGFTAECRVTVNEAAHEHTFGTPSYEWSDDNSKVTAKVSCTECGEEITETVNTAYEVIKEAGCEEEGTGRYTAVFANELFETQKKDVTIEATGHAYGTPVYTWSDDNSKVTAKVACTKCGEEITETVNTAYEVIKEPTVSETGTGRYTASFTNELFETQTKDVQIPKKPDVSITLSVDPKELSMVYGTTARISASVTPAGTELKWHSDNEEAVTVDARGNLSAKGIGKATITVTAGDSVCETVDVRVLFTDVADSGKYFFTPVYWAADNAITVGAGGPGKFSPDAYCTREQFVTFLWRTKGEPEPKTSSNFSDVKTSDWYYKSITWAAEEGITVGLNDGTGRFGVGQACTREQCVTFLYRAAGEPAVKKYASFTDVAAGRYYYKAISWAAENGITVGVNPTHFGVGQKCTRAMLVTFLYRSEVKS